MNKAQVAWSLLIVGLLLACIVMVHNMSEKLDHKGPVLAGQWIEKDGIRTQRWMDGDEPESEEVWGRRHLQAVKAFHEGD